MVCESAICTAACLINEIDSLDNSFCLYKTINVLDKNRDSSCSNSCDFIVSIFFVLKYDNKRLVAKISAKDVFECSMFLNHFIVAVTTIVIKIKLLKQ